ncbi:hypothetical protein [Gracilimonas sediminicola]|uniref:Uncharacterized protein n=1 Tax=Gracilimonas sediminicola TaxID=2952158 RepID=A0A9X2L2M2_9BACT|nr:hypothetical protein [Gracilimonas sediminicola]MCP9291196.1 hypothetical protein [Gracilimonas sediminicola]
MGLISKVTPTFVENDIDIRAVIVFGSTNSIKLEPIDKERFNKEKFDRIYFSGFTYNQQNVILEFIDRGYSEALKAFSYFGLIPVIDKDGFIYWKKSRNIFDQADRDKLDEKGFNEIGKGVKINSNLELANADTFPDIFVKRKINGNWQEVSFKNLSSNFLECGIENVEHELRFAGFSENQVVLIIQVLNVLIKPNKYTKPKQLKSHFINIISMQRELDLERAKKASRENEHYFNITYGNKSHNTTEFDRDEIGDPDLLDSWEDDFGES